MIGIGALLLVLIGAHRASAQFTLGSSLSFPTSGLLANAGTNGTSSNGTYGATYKSKLRDIHQIPYAWYSQGSPFQNIVVMGSGDFVVSGTCSPKVTRSGWRSLFTDGASGRNKELQGGLYAFKNDGTFIGMRDACLDGLSQTGTCNEGGACEGPVTVIPVANDKFVRVMHDVGGIGWNRPPMEYRITGSGLTLSKRAYISKGSNYDSESHDGRFAVGNLVKAGNALWGVKEENVSDGQLRYARTNILYTDTGFDAIREWSVSAPSSLYESWNQITPLAGVGDFVIGTKNGATSAYVYRVVDADTMDEWQRLEEVSALPGFAVNYGNPRYDSANPNRVAFATNFSAGSVNVDIYESATTTFSKVSTTPLTGVSGLGFPYAISGDYILYGACPSGNGSVLPVTDGTADPYKGCKVKVLKAGSLVGEIVLPKWSKFPLSENAGGTEQAQVISLDDAAQSIAMSSNGTILIGSRWGALYRYTIGGSTTSPTGGPAPIIGTGEFQTIGSYIDFANGYVRLLQAILNAQSGSPTESGTANSGTESATGNTSQFGSLFDQAVNLINSYAQ